MSGRGKGSKGLGKGRKREFRVTDKNLEKDDKRPLYVVKSVLRNGKKSVRVYKATFVSRGAVRGYKITVGGKRIGVKPGKAAFFDKYKAMNYASYKRGCKYGVDKASGACLTKSGRKARDYVKSSGGVGVGKGRSKISEEQARIAAMELNTGAYTTGKAKDFSAIRTRIGSYARPVKKKRTGRSAYQKYMKANLGSLKGMTKAARQAKFVSVAKGWKKLSPAEQAKYK